MLNRIIIAFTVGILMFSATAANAVDNSSKPYTVQDEITRSECGDCHMVFPAGRLTVNGWKKIMSDLGNHFGEDASLDDKTAKHIEAYMTSRAFNAKDTVPSKMKIKQWKKKGLVDPIRITETPGWKRHHRTKKYKLMAKDVGYERGSNCILCHKDAERGVYEEFPGMYE